jgi:hypothetical protein
MFRDYISAQNCCLGRHFLFRKIALVLVCICIVSIAGYCENPRVFVTDSKSWEVSGSSGGANGAFGGHVSGGARPQTAEIIKTFGERCKEVTVNNKQDKADYIVVLDHEGGKGIIRKDNKVAVFNGDGDSIVSKSTRSLGSSVEDACKAIVADWTANGSKAKAKPQAAATPPSKAAPELQTNIHIASQPASADIEVDGAFVGNTPSSVQLTPGDHKIVVKKTGFKEWTRVMKTSAGDVNVSAELEKGE